MKAKPVAVLILSLLAVVAAIPSLHGQEPDLSSPKLRIPYEEFKTLYDAKRIVVIDTRDVRSWEMGHIPGSRVIPAEQIGDHLAELRKLKKPIVTYCS